MTLEESQLEVKLTLWKAKQRNWKEIDLSLASLKLILLYTLYVISNRSLLLSKPILVSVTSTCLIGVGNMRILVL